MSRTKNTREQAQFAYSPARQRHLLFYPECAQYRWFCGILSLMSQLEPASFAALYRLFSAPIAALDCGKKCSPYNEGGAPFCCDTRHAIPSAYQAEWIHLQAHTQMWRPWQAAEPAETERMYAEAAPGQVLIECQGHRLCQREFRAMTCREFPFYPYITRQGDFIGISYYAEYEERCWVISNLDQVSQTYRQQFIAAYDALFALSPLEKERFRYHCGITRRIFGRQHRPITLLHRDGHTYEVTPRTGALGSAAEQLPKFGPYAVAARLAFPDEIETHINPQQAG
jgi:hypothetical protein